MSQYILFAKVWPQFLKANNREKMFMESIARIIYLVKIFVINSSILL
jgi:hypothetical protein